MKTAISIDDATFTQAEALAEQLGMSRSELYRAALTEYIQAHSAADITAALDRVYGAAPAQDDELRRKAAQRVFEQNEW